METEEGCDEDEDYGFERRLQYSSNQKERPSNTAKLDQKGTCSGCLSSRKFCTKLAAQSYDRHNSVKSAPSRLDHSSWTNFTADGNAPKSALCLSTLAKNVMQKAVMPVNKHGGTSNKGAMSQNSLTAARRRRLSELGLKRGRADDAIPPQFVFSNNYKKYIEAYRREKLIALQKHLFEDEIKAKFEEIAATLAVRRSFLDDLPEAAESAAEPPLSAAGPGRKEEAMFSDKMLARSQTTILPLNVISTEYKQNYSGAMNIAQQVTASLKNSNQIHLDFPANNQNANNQEVQSKGTDNNKRGGLVVYPKPAMPSSGAPAVQAAPALSSGNAKQQAQQQQAIANASTSKNTSTANMSNRSSVAKVFDVASFILDRDLLRRKMAEQLRSVENGSSGINVKPLGKMTNESKQGDVTPPPILISNGLGKMYPAGFGNPSLLLNSNGDSAHSIHGNRLLTAGDGDTVSRIRAQLSAEKASTSNDSAVSAASAFQHNGDSSFSDVKYWLLNSIAGRNGNNSQNSGANGNSQPNLAMLKQQANELKSLQRQPSSNATSNDSANIPVKLKTFNAAEAIPPTAKPTKPRQWPLTTGGQRYFLGPVGISTRGDEANGTPTNVTNTTSNASQPPPPVAAAHNNNTISNNPASSSSNNNTTSTTIISNHNNNNHNNMQTIVTAAPPIFNSNPVAATNDLTILTVAPPNSMRLFSDSNSRVRTANPVEVVLPTASAIANGASQIASSMLSQAATSERQNRSHDYRQMLTGGGAGDTSPSSSLNIANVIVEALSRRNRYQNPKRTTTVKILRKQSAGHAANNKNNDNSSNNAPNGGGASVALRLTTPADYPAGGQRFQQPSPLIAHSLSNLGMNNGAAATELP